ncbi:SCO6745 family protein [Nonomuraea sp. CA-141351]|uniref:SCO6745 family protein n=1 Tax=Nonomuraea sp. CA-141351 TaxID=3239996 RepID=UPI003D8A3825
MSASSRLARRMWHQLEPIHAVLYFSPQAFEEAAALGYDVESRWPSYFAYRTAPLGRAGSRLATAAYYSFSPRTIGEHVPAVWKVASPERVLDARLTAVDRTYRHLLGDKVTGPDVTEAAELARRAAESVTVAGRPLAAANLDLPWPAEPHLVLWQAATVLREHRGDGHLAALQAAGLDGCESLVSFAAIDAAPVANFAGRGWSEQEWNAARERLAARGLVGPDGQATEQGRALRDQVERMTDELAAEPWRLLGDERAERLAQLASPFLGAVFEAGLLPMTSTLGIATVKAPD